MIAVVDSGVANLTSVMAALERLGVPAEVTADVARIKNADRVILPGVGAAAPAMARLKAKNLVDTLRGLTQPVLGICLGMQILFTRSHEGKGEPVACLGVMPGDVKAMKASPDAPVPHMGWNQITPKQADHTLLRGIEPGSYVYFVHGYAAPVGDTTVATADYGGTFAAIVGHRNFFGCQFHPERSGEVGSKVIANFLSLHGTV
jgi:glutamine amidotransferase